MGRGGAFPPSVHPNWRRKLSVARKGEKNGMDWWREGKYSPVFSNCVFMSLRTVSVPQHFTMGAIVCLGEKAWVFCFSHFWKSYVWHSGGLALPAVGGQACSLCPFLCLSCPLCPLCRLVWDHYCFQGISVLQNVTVWKELGLALKCSYRTLSWWEKTWMYPMAHLQNSLSVHHNSSWNTLSAKLEESSFLER